MNKIILLLFPVMGLFLPVALLAQPVNYWTATTESAQEKTHPNRKIIPDDYQVFNLDIDAIEQTLNRVGRRFSPQAKSEAKTLAFPLPDGTFEPFAVLRADVLHPDLAARYPGIRSYAGHGTQDASAFIRFDITPLGFHAVIYSAHHSSIYIDPYMDGNRTSYISYYTKDYHRDEAATFECSVGDATYSRQEQHEYSGDTEKLLIGDCTLRKYRLALACTGEYAQFHGGTVASVLAAMNTSMMRVNGVYESEASITMEIIPNNDEIIFLNGGSDPYTNGNGGTMLGENQTTIDNIIGTQNYDIGHVFSTGGGGIASLESPCTNRKARGVTGQDNPVGDFFDIDYVAHEMGHQFGANHTQNNDCNRVANYSSVEPGSASTIMGYAGICAPNVQAHSDDYFHAFNLREMSNFVTNGAGGNCPVEIFTGNQAPSANGGGNHTVPVSTPFELTGTANDNDNSGTLTYCWEQMDAEIASMPPLPTNTGGPAFRSYSPTPSPTRVFPPIDNIINNSSAEWDVLPSVGRNMNFTLTVRDNNPGSGCVASDDINLTFAANAGPFIVTAPNTNIEWNVGTTQTVTWDVANTDQSPVNSTEVDIFLSTDGGYTYPITLAENVPNTGTYDIITPDNIGNQNRVKVKGANNVFFDISDQNFTIVEALIPDFQMQLTPGVVDICLDETANFDINILTFVNFSEVITFSINGLPDGVVAEFSPETIHGDGSVQLTLSNFESIDSGSYDMEVVATAASISKSEFITINLTAGVPATPVLTAPVSGSDSQSMPVNLSWEAVNDVASYTIEVASSPTFSSGSIISTQSSISPNYTLQSLDPLTVYYWRVTGVNGCGSGAYSPVWSFQTLGVDCKNYFSIESIEISPDGTPTIQSTIQVNDEGNIVSTAVQELSIIHSWVGDLDATLTSPEGTILQLFDQPGVPNDDYGCDGNNILVDFTDDAPNSANDFENTCSASTPAIEGFYQPITPFTNLNEEAMQGEWILTITDHENNDGGQLESWGLEICFGLASPVAINLDQNDLIVQNAQMGTIDENYLQASATGHAPDELVYVLLSLPVNGVLTQNGTPMEIGDSFTQAAINSGLIVYLHDGSQTMTDDFIFDVFGNDTSWSGNHTFHIIIEENTLSASLMINNEIDCFNEPTGSISAAAESGIPPYTYSLNNGDFQEEATFSGLAAGSYMVTVRDSDGGEVTTNTILLENPTILEATNTIMGSQISIQASGGTGSLQYSIDGATFQSSSVFSNVDVGAFTITVRDENGCTTTTSGEIIDSSLSATATVLQEISCADEQDGSIEVISSGGTAPFTYSIDGVNFQSSNLFEGLGAGEYTFTIRDANDITFTTEIITLQHPIELTLDYTLDGNNATLTGAGGTGTLMYAIDEGSFALDNEFNDLNNGDHTLRVKDENGCETSRNITINTILSAGVETSILSCHDGSDGSISITSVVGGNAPYSYQLNNGEFQDSNTFENLPAGDYNVTIQDNLGQTYSLDVTLGNPAPITVDLVLDDNDLTINAEGPGNLMYSIDGGATFSTENIFSDLPNGEYDIVVTNENDCTASASITINTITMVTYTIDQPHCTGSNNGLIGITEVIGGVPPYTYSLDQINFSTSPVFAGLPAGNYTVSIMDNQGHIYEIEVTISDPELPTVTTVVDGSDLTINVSPTGDYQYSIDGGTTYTTNNFFPNLPNGTYPILVLDENDCASTETIEINVDATIDIENEIEFVIFPNPNDGNMRIRLKHPARELLKITVYDVLGRIVMESQVEKRGIDFEHSMAIKHPTSGTYFVKIVGETINIAQSIIIENRN